MAEDQGKQQAAASQAKQEEPRYDADYLVSHSRALTGSIPSIVAGALATSRRKTHTVEEARRLIREFQKQPVEHAGSEE